MFELKPCPFCGAENVTYIWEQDVCYAKCKACGTTGSKHFAIDDANEAWNRRVNTEDAVEVVHGRWITFKGEAVPLDTDGCPVRSCLCSVCGDWLTASDEYACVGKYCPNCGAKMDGDGNV